MLGVGRDATQEDIKKAYRRKAMEHHPDRGGDERSFKELQEAYDTLSDDGKKRNYDTYGSAAGPGQGGRHYDFSDFFSGFGMNSPFGGPRKAHDVAVRVDLSLEEVISGATKQVRYRRRSVCAGCQGRGGTRVEKCQACGGHGQVIEVVNHFFGHVRRQTACRQCSGTGSLVSDRCGRCSGQGTLEEDASVEATFPRGVSAGQTMVFKGRGHSAWDLDPGDLNIVVGEIPDPSFRREGLNLVHELRVSVPDAVLGCQVTVDSPTGRIRLSVPAGCEPGKVLSARGKGIPSSSGVCGDLLVRVSVEVPSELTEEQRALYEALKKTTQTL